MNFDSVVCWRQEHSSACQQWMLNFGLCLDACASLCDLFSGGWRACVAPELISVNLHHVYERHSCYTLHTFSVAFLAWWIHSIQSACKANLFISSSLICLAEVHDHFTCAASLPVSKVFSIPDRLAKHHTLVADLCWMHWSFAGCTSWCFDTCIIEEPYSLCLRIWQRLHGAE